MWFWCARHSGEAPLQSPWQTGRRNWSCAKREWRPCPSTLLWCGHGLVFFSAPITGFDPGLLPLHGNFACTCKLQLRILRWMLWRPCQCWVQFLVLPKSSLHGMVYATLSSSCPHRTASVRSVMDLGVLTTNLVAVAVLFPCCPC